MHQPPAGRRAKRIAPRTPPPDRRTQSVRQITREEKRRAMKPQAPAWRPKKRADCAQVPRPCPFVGCRYNLALDANDRGSIRYNLVNHDGVIRSDLNNCCLDLADRGPMTLDQIADYFDLTRERIRQQETEALARLQRGGTLEEARPDFIVGDGWDEEEPEACLED